MPMFRYAGPDPVTDPDDGEIVRPGQRREMDEPPGWGPWDEIGEDGDGPEAPPDAPPPPADAAPAPAPAGRAKPATKADAASEGE